jgi:hypothetical protein
LHDVYSRLLGLAPGALTWDRQSRRAIGEEKKQSYSPHGATLNRNAARGELLQYDHHSITTPRSGRDLTCAGIRAKRYAGLATAELASATVPLP